MHLKRLVFILTNGISLQDIKVKKSTINIDAKIFIHVFYSIWDINI